MVRSKNYVDLDNGEHVQKPLCRTGERELKDSQKDEWGLHMD